MNDIQLANMVYSLCAGAFMVAGGMLGIIIGWKKNFRIGVILAIIGELMLAISTNVVMFTWGGRLLVGLGASFMIPSVLGLIPGIYSGKERVFAFGAIGAATGIAAAAGPIVAGFLLDAFGFRVAFGALAVYFFLILIGSTAIPEVERSTKKLKMDVRGTIVAAIGLFLFLIGISKISVWGLITPLQAPFTLFGISPSLPLALLGVIILALLVVMEKSIEQKNGMCPASFLLSEIRAGSCWTVRQRHCIPVSGRYRYAGKSLSAGCRRVQCRSDRGCDDLCRCSHVCGIHGGPEICSAGTSENDSSHRLYPACRFRDPYGILFAGARSIHRHVYRFDHCRYRSGNA